MVGMAIAEPDGGYTVDDLDWLRDELGVGHLELDPWGCLIVTPTSDEHETAISVLLRQLVRRLALPAGCVRPNGTPWTVPGGSGYHNEPDLIVLPAGWQRVEDEHFEPPPLLLIEVGSPSTRRVDRTRKLSDYRLGGAGLYVLVDPPATFEVHDFGADRIWTATGSVDLRVGTETVHLELP